MVAKSTCVFAIAITLVLCGSNVQGLITDNPIQNAIEQAVSDAMSKIFQGMGSVTNQVTSSVASNVNDVQSVVGAFAQPLVSSTGSIASQLLDDYKTMGQTVFNGYKTLGNQMLGSLAGVGSTMGLAYDQLETVLNAYEAQWCTPATFTPSVKKPAKFMGHGFELVLSAGACTFNEEILIECKVTKTFGEPLTKVLYVFDGAAPVDLNAITATVMTEIKGVTGAIGGAHQALAGQLTTFLGSIPTLGAGLKLPSLNFS
ncbi:hypothetical protein Ndes2437B_g02687 [Nannochloris sp. 'desiccata']